MGGGASKGHASSVAIKESFERSSKLEQEVQRLEQEKQELEQQLNEKNSDIEQLGELNRNLEREKENLANETQNSMEDQKSAEKSISELKKEMEAMRAQFFRLEAELRDTKGELNIEKEEHGHSRTEIERVGKMLTEAISEKEQVENKMKSIQEEKDEIEGLLRAAKESSDLYKDLSSKLMQKKASSEEAKGKDTSSSIKEESKDVSTYKKVVEKVDVDNLAMVKPKMAGRLKVCVISTFEDFFMERDLIRKEVYANLAGVCEARNIALELVDLWEGVHKQNVSTLTQNFHVGSLYLKEIEDSDIVVIMLGERYGQEIGEEVGAKESASRQWLQRYRAQSSSYGSTMHLATMYAAFYCGSDNSLPTYFQPCRTLAYFRDPTFINGLPETMIQHFEAESGRSASKLTTLKEKLKETGIVREEAYADPQVLSNLLYEDIKTIIDKSFPESFTRFDRDVTVNESFMETHAWIGQGGRGLLLPEEVNSMMDRIRRYFVGDAAQPLVIIGEAGSGRTAMMHANIKALMKRFPPPDTTHIYHFTGCSNDAKDPSTWIYNVCKKLKSETGIQLEISQRPDELIKEFNQWLEAVSSTGLKLFLFLDGVDACQNLSMNEDPVWFVPKNLPQGVRMLLSTGAGSTLTSLAQRGCGALTLKPLDEKQKQTLIEGYLARENKTEFARKGISRLVGSDKTGNPQFLCNVLGEIHSIGVLDGVATMEPVQYFLEADHLPMMIEKVLYRWESNYTGKGASTSLVRDALTCIWASRYGLLRTEIVKMLDSTHVHLSKLLRDCSLLMIGHAGMFNFQSQTMSQVIQQRYMPTHDGQMEAHQFLANFFEDESNSSLTRRIEELPWQLMQAGDSERLCKCISETRMFLKLWDQDFRLDCWRYVRFLEQQNVILSLGMYCKASSSAFELEDPKPEPEVMAEAKLKYGAFMAELGFMEVSLEFLLKANDTWNEMHESEDERVAQTLETVAKVLANLKSPEASKYFERALQTRNRLCKKTGPDTKLAMLHNDWGLHLKRESQHNEAIRNFMRASEIWTRKLGANHLHVSTANLNISTTCYAMGNMQTASEHAALAMEIRKEAVGVNHPLYAEALLNFAAVELGKEKMGRARREAEILVRQAIAIFERTRGGQHADTLWARSFLTEGFGASLIDGDDDTSDEDGDDEQGKI